MCNDYQETCGEQQFKPVGQNDDNQALSANLWMEQSRVAPARFELSPDYIFEPFFPSTPSQQNYDFRPRDFSARQPVDFLAGLYGPQCCPSYSQMYSEQPPFSPSFTGAQKSPAQEALGDDYRFARNANGFSVQKLPYEVASPSEQPRLINASFNEAPSEMFDVVPVAYTPDRGSKKRIEIPAVPLNTDGRDSAGKESFKQPIEWRSTTLQAYEDAVTLGEPLVILFGNDKVFKNPQSNTARQLKEMNEDRSGLVRSLGNRGVWVVGNTTTDDAARSIADYLQIKDFPTLSVIEPRADKIEVRFQMEGYFPLQQMAEHLNGQLYPGVTPPVNNGNQPLKPDVRYA
ncbi:MAG TPA: hypothetical protein V6D17_13645 [Candidatus Obscuribacterales bacterium]